LGGRLPFCGTFHPLDGHFVPENADASRLPPFGPMTSLTALLSFAYRVRMATLTVRDLDDSVRDKLRVRAAAQGRSMEAEVRAILTEAVASPLERSLVDTLREFSTVLADSGYELEPMARQPARDPFA
jgi:plasmid stability protein